MRGTPTVHAEAINPSVHAVRASLPNDMKVAYSIRDDSGAAVITCLRVAGGAKVLFHQVHRDFLAYVWAGGADERHHADLASILAEPQVFASGHVNRELRRLTGNTDSPRGSRQTHCAYG